MTDTTNPITTVFEFQRTAVERSQQATHDALSAQKAAVETLAESAEAVQSLQARTAEMSQEAAHAYLDAVESALPEDAADFAQLREAVDDGFDGVDDLQADVWESVDEAIDENVAAFDEFADNYADAADTAFDSYLDAHEQVEDGVAGVADDFENAAN